MNMDRAKRFVSTLEHILSTKKKRHMVGGILLSASMFFGVLALTALTTKIEEEIVDEPYDN